MALPSRSIRLLVHVLVLVRFAGRVCRTLFVLFGFGAAALADVTTHSVTLTVAADTSIFQNNPDYNLGGTTLVAGTNQQYSRSRALLRFDVSSIPAGAVIQQARVSMSVVRRPDPDQHGGPVDSEFSLHRCRVPWGQGTGSAVTGTPAQFGDATWTYHQYPTAAWTFPGGGAGDDYEASPSTSTLIGGVGDYVFESTPAIVADVQAWLDDPSGNFGFILATSNEFTPGTARRWASLEQNTGGLPARLNVIYEVSDSPAGQIDAGFDPAPNGRVVALAPSADGKLIVGGDFSEIGGTPHAGIARLDAAGALDGSFSAVADASVECVSVEPGGRVFIGGQFSTVAGVSRSHLSALQPDGAVDSFAPEPNAAVHALVLQSDRRILVAGAFTEIAAGNRSHLARLNPDGTLDSSFAADANADVYTVVLGPDGRILIGGAFTMVNGVTRNHVARLYADGSVDPTFNPDADNLVQCIALQADGKILVGGQFSVIDGVGHAGVVRLLADGTQDGFFGANVSGGVATSVSTIVVQADGQILLGGDFTMASGFARHGIARLAADGSLDVFFNPTASDVVHCLALQHNGQIVVGGDFTSIAGADRIHLARLHNDPAISTLSAPEASRVQWLRGGTVGETQRVTFELSGDGGQSWSPLGGGTRIPGGWELRGVSLPAAGQIRANAFVTGGEFGGSMGTDSELLQRITAPGVVTGSAVAITSMGATLGGTVDPNNAPASAAFEYGLSASYGSVAASGPPTVTGDTPVAVSAVLSGLLPRTVYHYRVKATNSGGTSLGDDATFTTANTAPVAASGAFTVANGRLTAIDLASLTSDADGDTRTFFAGSAAHGTVTVENGTLLYEPEPGYHGTDLVSYWVSDGFGGVATGTLTLTVPARPPDLVVELAALEGNPILPSTGAVLLPPASVWVRFGAPAVNQAGDLAFVAIVREPAAEVLSGVFSGTISAPNVVALTGAPAPGIPGSHFHSFRSPVLAESGAVAFRARVASDAGQHVVTGASDVGIWSDAATGELALVARTGFQAADAPPGAKWTAFQSVALPDGAPGPLFTARMSGGGVKRGTDVGLWGASRSGALRLLLREGDPIGAKFVKNFAVLAPVVASAGQTRSFNRAAEVVVRANFTDGSSGLVRVDVP